jgi:ClpP class serine protease
MSSGLRKIKSVSFTEREFKLLLFAEEKGKFSEYIKALIIKDMNRLEHLTPEIKVEIRRFIEESYSTFKEKPLDELEVESQETQETQETHSSLDEILNM